MSGNTYMIAAIAVMAVVTAAIRVVPFLIFGSGKKIPKAVTRLGNLLPPATMGMLVIYCFKDVKVTSAPYGIPELIASAVVVVLHLIKRNTLLSIISGVVVYMIIIRFI